MKHLQLRWFCFPPLGQEKKNVALFSATNPSKTLRGKWLEKHPILLRLAIICFLVSLFLVFFRVFFLGGE